MTMIYVDPRTDPLWERLVNDCPYSSVFNSPRWITVLAKTYGWEPSALILCDEGDQPVAGLAFFHIDDMISERIVSLPFSDFCDPTGSDPAHWHTLGSELIRQGVPVTMRCLHNEAPLSDNRFGEVKLARWHGIDLRPDTDTLWRTLDRTARQCIDKARREGVIIQPATDKCQLRAFFEMHLRVRKYKYHMLAQPFRFFDAIWDQFIETNRGALMIATCGEKIIGGGFFLIWKDGLYYKFNTSNPDGLDHRPNDLIVWESIQFGKTRDCTLFDFGLSDWDQTGLARYKRKFGAYEKTIHFLQHTPAEPLASDNHRSQRVRGLFPQLTDLFTEAAVPDAITEQAGNVLYRFFT